MRNHYAQSVMVGNTAAMTPVVCARGISFLGALRTVRAHGEYNYRSSLSQPQRPQSTVHTISEPTGQQNKTKRENPLSSSESV